MMNNRKNDNRILVFTGLAIGFAAGYLLNSNRGRKLSKDAIAVGQDYKGQIASKTTEMADAARTSASEAIDSIAKTLESTSAKVAKQSKQLKKSTERAIDKATTKVEKAVSSN